MFYRNFRRPFISCSLTQPAKFLDGNVIICNVIICSYAANRGQCCMCILVDDFINNLLPKLAMNSAKSVFLPAFAGWNKLKAPFDIANVFSKLLPIVKSIAFAFFRVSSTLLRLPTSSPCSKLSGLACFVNCRFSPCLILRLQLP